MEKLYKGIHMFQQTFFKKEEEFFRRLSKRQTPEVLFITCADARLDPNLITQSKPGELFIMRNVGNIIPPQDALKYKSSVAAGLEFAVLGLKVTDIIVCGHSNCGAIELLSNDLKQLDGMPHLWEWLQFAAPAKNMSDSYCSQETPDCASRIMEKENVLVQLRNIQTYPFVAESLKGGTLFLHGWHYDIGAGEIFAYNPATDVFERIG
ncbi:MAG: carbonic anhydrase [Syntrophales bacterium]|nr:carbonic anhydrase [Syntrophales bacterium]